MSVECENEQTILFIGDSITDCRCRATERYCRMINGKIMAHERKNRESEMPFFLLNIKTLIIFWAMSLFLISDCAANEIYALDSSNSQLTDIQIILGQGINGKYVHHPIMGLAGGKQSFISNCHYIYQFHNTKGNVIATATIRNQKAPIAIADIEFQSRPNVFFTSISPLFNYGAEKKSYSPNTEARQWIKLFSSAAIHLAKPPLLIETGTIGDDIEINYLKNDNSSIHAVTAINYGMGSISVTIYPQELPDGKYNILKLKADCKLNVMPIEASVLREKGFKIDVSSYGTEIILIVNSLSADLSAKNENTYRFMLWFKPLDGDGMRIPLDGNGTVILLNSREKILEWIKILKTHGITDLLFFPFSRGGEKMCMETSHPMFANMKNAFDYDMLKAFCEAGRQEKVNIWIGLQHLKDFPLNTNLENFSQRPTGGKEKSGYTCPNSEIARHVNSEVMKTIAGKYSVAGFVIDDFGNLGCLCDYCKSKFKEKCGKDLRKDYWSNLKSDNPVIRKELIEKGYIDFLDNSMSEFWYSVSNEILSVRKDIKFMPSYALPVSEYYGRCCYVINKGAGESVSMLPYYYMTKSIAQWRESVQAIRIGKISSCGKPFIHTMGGELTIGRNKDADKRAELFWTHGISIITSGLTDGISIWRIGFCQGEYLNYMYKLAESARELSRLQLKPVHYLGIPYSMPTKSYLFHGAEFYGYNPCKFLKYNSGYLNQSYRLFSDAHLPGIEFFWADDFIFPDKLAEYQILYLDTSVACIGGSPSEPNTPLWGIAQYIENGGKVIIGPNFARYDESGNLRTKEEYDKILFYFTGVRSLSFPEKKAQDVGVEPGDGKAEIASVDKAGVEITPVKPGIQDAIDRGDFQIVEGFRQALYASNGNKKYTDYRGGCLSWWEYSLSGDEKIVWKTADPPRKKDTVFVFAGMTHKKGIAELYINNEYILSFDTGIAGNKKWNKNNYIFYYDFKKQTNVGEDSGVYYLKVPAEKIKAGEALEIKIKHEKSPQNAWFMIKAFTDNILYEKMYMDKVINILMGKEN